jgi:hypothetical protein
MSLLQDLNATMLLDLLPRTATHGKVDVLLVFSVCTNDVGDAITVLGG